MGAGRRSQGVPNAERIHVSRVSEITGLSVRQIQNMAAAGKLPSAAKLGTIWTFEEVAIRQWIADKVDEVQHRGAARERWDAPRISPEDRKYIEAWEKSRAEKRGRRRKP